MCPEHTALRILVLILQAGIADVILKKWKALRGRGSGSAGFQIPDSKALEASGAVQEVSGCGWLAFCANHQWSMLGANPI